MVSLHPQIKNERSEFDDENNMSYTTHKIEHKRHSNKRNSNKHRNRLTSFPYIVRTVILKHTTRVKDVKHLNLLI